MTVYVDDFDAPFRGMKMCHMIADNKQELINFAGKLGLKPEWIQDKGHFVHFDISQSMKVLALSKGAKSVTAAELVKIAIKNREQAKGNQ